MARRRSTTRREGSALGPLPDGDFHMLAGFLLFLFEKIPAVGERIDWRGWTFE
jgi:CBS domain containing-hemolysin-like protein